ncbi:MAG TPA: hypothetical protein PK995_02010 [Bacteroidia bacterium]|nr:hypothetical protein [Bacteroidia bacterium]
MLLNSSISIFVSLISFFYYLFSIFFDNGVTVTLNVPNSIKPGETVNAEIIIKKGNVSGFAKLQIQLDNGIVIVPEETGKKELIRESNFSENTEKWIWTALPMESEFKVKFKISAKINASGQKRISGKFSYIVNNTKQVVEIPPVIINIGESSEPITQNTSETSSVAATPTPTTEISVNTNSNVNVAVETNTTQQTPIETPTNTNVSITPPASTNVQMNRQIENIAPNVWIIKITIDKNGAKGFAKYSDILPDGLKANAEEKDGSSFFVDGKTIQFVWSNLPDKSILNISYKLTGTLSSAVTLNGTFSFTENNQVVNQTLKPETIQPSVITSTPTISEQPTTPPSANIAETSTKAKQTSVFFSVQLGAFLRSNVRSNYFVRKYNIPNVKEENHESYKKFYSGNFDEYKKARDYRENIKQKGIQDAFVIAHKDNVRITVQEALMITNQKWYP